MPLPPIVDRSEGGKERVKRKRKDKVPLTQLPKEKAEAIRVVRRAKEKRKKASRKARRELGNTSPKPSYNPPSEQTWSSSAILSPPNKVRRDGRGLSFLSLPSYADLMGAPPLAGAILPGRRSPTTDQPPKKGGSDSGTSPSEGGGPPKHTHPKVPEKTSGKGHGRGRSNVRGRGRGRGQSKGPANLRTPGQVIKRGEPKFVLLITKTGVSGDELTGEIQRVLFTIPEDIVVSRLEPAGTGRAQMSVHNEASAETVREVLTSRGFGVSTPGPAWRRYTFIVPRALASLDPRIIAEQLGVRNRYRGFPQGALRYANIIREEGEGSGQVQGGNRAGGSTRIWVDVSPEGETFLRDNDYLLATVTGAVRLWPAHSGPSNPRSHSTPDRS